MSEGPRPKNLLERSDLKPDDELIWQPSGLRVKLLGIFGPSTVRVEAPRGGKFVVELSALTRPEPVAAADDDVDNADMFNARSE